MFTPTEIEERVRHIREEKKKAKAKVQAQPDKKEKAQEEVSEDADEEVQQQFNAMDFLGGLQMMNHEEEDMLAQAIAASLESAAHEG